MLSKTKKLLFLTTGLAGALVVSSAAGIALSSCTVEAVNGGNGSSSDGITLPDTWYNKDINWTDATSLNNLIIDKQGFVYSNKYMTEIIAILPGYESSTLVIPSKVTSISGYNNVTVDSSGNTTRTPAGAFQNLTSITNLKFAGNKITTIGARAFYGCTGLQNVVLPSSVTLIDSYAFQNCSALNSINLNNVQYIGTSAFNAAMANVPTGTVSLNLNKVVLISPTAFINATGIGTIDFSKNTTLTQVSEGAFSGCTGLSGDIDLSNATKLITIGNATTPGTGSSFKDTSITNVYLPTNAGLRTIASSSFYGCTNLITVGPKGTTGFTATESVLVIHNKAFYGTKIASVDISSIVIPTPLETGAFSGMTKLASVNLGTKITTIPSSCFMNCSSLTTLTLPTSITSISGGGTATYTTGATPNITFTTNNTNDIAYPAFYGSGLTSIDLSTITSYQTTANATLNLPDTLFYNCPNLTTVTLKEGTTSIGKGTFANTTSLTSIYTKEGTTSGEGYIAASNIASIGQYAFWKSGISSVNLSAINTTSYNTLQSYTFMDCANLVSIVLPTTITSISTYAVYNTPELTTADLSELHLTSIDNYNFSDCKLNDVDLTSSTISQIPATSNNLFRSLTSSTTVKLPSSLWNIAASTTAFTYSGSTTDSSGSTTPTLIPLSITFPDGFAPSDNVLTNFISSSGKGNLNAHTMFSRVTEKLDLSSFTQLKSIGIRTFFGGPVSSLVFNASTFADGKFGSNYNVDGGAYSYLGFLGSDTTNSTTSETSFIYANTSLPFGDMTNLNNITFNKFSSVTSTTTIDNVLSKTTSETWDQVARIISSFGKEATENIQSTANLTTWDLENDTITALVETDDNSNSVISVNLHNTNNQVNVNINNSNKTATLEIAGVNWTINVDDTNGTITISAIGINTYRVLKNTIIGAGPGYKAFFNKTTSTNNDGQSIDIPDSEITVTLNVVPATTNS